MKKTLTVLLVASSLALAGCGNDSDVNIRNNRAEKLERAQPVQKIDYSTDRDNINKRLKLKNDQNRITWVYCISPMGNVLASSTAVGGITSSNKRLEPKINVTEPLPGINGGTKTYELVGADGTYGESDSYVYWFTPEGQYQRWGGLIYESEVPLKLERPVLNVRDIDYQELQRARNAETALRAGKKINNKLEVEVNQ